MSQEMVERFLGRLLTDDQFRDRVLRSCAESCREEGLFLSSEELASIRLEDIIRIEWVAARLDKNIKRFSRKGEMSVPVS